MVARTTAASTQRCHYLINDLLGSCLGQKSQVSGERPPRDPEPGFFHALHAARPKPSWQRGFHCRITTIAIPMATFHDVYVIRDWKMRPPTTASHLQARRLFHESSSASVR